MLARMSARDDDEDVQTGESGKTLGNPALGTVEMSSGDGIKERNNNEESVHGTVLAVSGEDFNSEFLERRRKILN